MPPRITSPLRQPARTPATPAGPPARGGRVAGGRRPLARRLGLVSALLSGLAGLTLVGPAQAAAPHGARAEQATGYHDVRLRARPHRHHHRHGATAKAPGKAHTTAKAGKAGKAGASHGGRLPALPVARPTKDFYVNQLSQAWNVAQKDPSFAEIGNTPQAFWMSDTFMPLDQVQAIARGYVERADAAGKTPLLAVYAIPARDCGGYSAGGWGAAAYKTWTTRMALGLRGSDAVVVLEPDALGLLGTCDGQGNRTGLIRHAAKVMSRAGARVYVDAGHHGWIDPDTMAARLVKAGVGYAQGFAVDTASTVRPAIEQQYAEDIAARLTQLGAPGKTYVMDTSRNGGTGSLDGADWCNPLFARLGAKPRWLYQGRLDAYLWVKGPGESDGACNGGPSAGLWWPEYARLLMSPA